MTKSRAPRKKKKVSSQEELALFPQRAPDPLPLAERHPADLVTFLPGEWVCARCLRETAVDRRTSMVFFGSDARESQGINVCTGCAFTFMNCLEKQTQLTPIHAPPSPKLVGVGEGVEPEPERLHPWET